MDIGESKKILYGIKLMLLGGLPFAFLLGGLFVMMSDVIARRIASLFNSDLVVIWIAFVLGPSLFLISGNIWVNELIRFKNLLNGNQNNVSYKYIKILTIVVALFAIAALMWMLSME